MTVEVTVEVIEVVEMADAGDAGVNESATDRDDSRVARSDGGGVSGNGGSTRRNAHAEGCAESARGHGGIGLGERSKEPGSERIIDSDASVEGDEAGGGEWVVVDDES